jgi:hypothetical protein
MAKPFYPPGCYRCRIIGQQFGESSTGNPMFVLKFQVLECLEPFNDSFPQYERKAYFAVTEKTYERVLNDLRNIGFTGHRFVEIDPDTPGYQNFAGTEVEMHCMHDEDQNGNLRERWIARGDTLKPLSDKRRLNSLDARFAKTKQCNSQPPAPVDAGEYGITDEDVNF